jgi:hypothetical protein
MVRRGKKTKMKLGIQPADTDESMPIEQRDRRSMSPNMALAPTKKASGEDEVTASKELNMDILGYFSNDESQQADPVPPAEPVNVSNRLDTILTAPTPATAVAKASNPPQAEPVELMRLMRDPETGNLLVGIGDMRFSKLTDITDRKIGQFVLEMAAHFLVFTNGKIFSATGLQNLLRPQVNDLPDLPIQVPTPSRQSDSLVPPPSPEAEAALLASLQSRKITAQSDPPLKRGGF